ncbi:MAG: DUF5615 family PIN-like protein [Phycisphaerales bacterium]|nr:DUF5615 family PIN-like protein [Phycisphaerales bacterium]
MAFLRDGGFDVLTVFDDESLRSAGDDIILQRAFEENRVVLTHDADFGTIAVAGFRPVVGIVFLRPGHIDPKSTIETLRFILAGDFELQPPFVLVAVRQAESVRVRVRRLG